jgi:hypothetical protein
LKAVHLTELRTAVLAVRALAGLPPVTCTDDAVPGTTVRAIHITELRTALDPALTALSLVAGAYSEQLPPEASSKACTSRKSGAV